MRILVSAATTGLLSTLLLISGPCTTPVSGAATPLWTTPVYSNKVPVTENPAGFSEAGVHGLKPQVYDMGGGMGALGSPTTWKGYNVTGSNDGRDSAALCQGVVRGGCITKNGLAQYALNEGDKPAAYRSVLTTYVPVWYHSFVYLLSININPNPFWVFTTPFTFGATYIGDKTFLFEKQSDEGTPQNVGYWYNSKQVLPIALMDGVIVMQEKANAQRHITEMRLVKYQLGQDLAAPLLNLIVNSTKVLWSYNLTAPYSENPGFSMNITFNNSNNGKKVYAVIGFGASSLQLAVVSVSGAGTVSTESVSCIANWTATDSSYPVNFVGLSSEAVPSIHRLVAWQLDSHKNPMLAYVDDIITKCSGGAVIRPTKSYNYASEMGSSTDVNIVTEYADQQQVGLCYPNTITGSYCCATQKLGEASAFDDSVCASKQQNATFLTATKDADYRHMMILQMHDSTLLGYKIGDTIFAWLAESAWQPAQWSTENATTTGPRASLVVLGSVRGRLFFSAHSGEWALTFTGAQSLLPTQVSLNLTTGAYQTMFQSAASGLSEIALPVPSSSQRRPITQAVLVSYGNFTSGRDFEQMPLDAPAGLVGTALYPYFMQKTFSGSDGSVYILGNDVLNATANYIEKYDGKTYQRVWKKVPDQLATGSQWVCPGAILAETFKFVLMGLQDLGAMDYYYSKLWLVAKSTGESKQLSISDPQLCGANAAGWLHDTLRITTDTLNDVFFVSNGNKCIMRIQVSLPTGSANSSPLMSTSRLTLSHAISSQGNAELFQYDSVTKRLFFQMSGGSSFFTAQRADSAAHFSSVVSKDRKTVSSISGFSSDLGQLTSVFGNIYVASSENLYCLDATTFDFKWVAPAQSTPKPSINTESYHKKIAPAASNGYIIQFSRITDGVTTSGESAMQARKFYAEYRKEDGTTPAAGEHVVVTSGVGAGWSGGGSYSAVPSIHVFDFGKAFVNYAGHYVVLDLYTLIGNYQSLDYNENCPGIFGSSSTSVWLVCKASIGFTDSKTVMRAKQVSYKKELLNTIDLGEYDLANPTYSVNPGVNIWHSPMRQILNFYSCPDANMAAPPSTGGSAHSAETGTAPTSGTGFPTLAPFEPITFSWWILGVVFGSMALVGGLGVTFMLILARRQRRQREEQSLLGTQSQASLGVVGQPVVGYPVAADTQVNNKEAV